MKIHVLLSGRNYEAASALPAALTLPDGATLDDALVALDQLLPADARLPGSCLVAVSGLHLGTRVAHASRVLVDGDELVLIAPVAGG